MIKLDLEVTYTSGETATYVAALPEWSKWERKFNKSIYGLKSLESFQLSDFLFLAHSAYVREAAGKPTKSYDIWELSVDGITVKDHELPKVTKSELLNENATN